jgi:hypothetical protein
VNHFFIHADAEVSGKPFAGPVGGVVLEQTHCTGLGKYLVPFFINCRRRYTGFAYLAASLQHLADDSARRSHLLDLFTGLDFDGHPPIFQLSVHFGASIEAQ